MPKRTKKEKIIAQYRKKMLLLNQQVKTKSSHPAINITNPKTEPNQPLVENKTVVVEDKIAKNYFFQDFKKSFILITSIIVLEIIFYFVSIRYKL